MRTHLTTIVRRLARTDDSACIQKHNELHPIALKHACAIWYDTILCDASKKELTLHALKTFRYQFISFVRLNFGTLHTNGASDAPIYCRGSDNRTLISIAVSVMEFGTVHDTKDNVRFSETVSFGGGNMLDIKPKVWSKPSFAPAFLKIPTTSGRVRLFWNLRRHPLQFFTNNAKHARFSRLGREIALVKVALNRIVEQRRCLLQVLALLKLIVAGISKDVIYRVTLFLCLFIFSKVVFLTTVAHTSVGKEGGRTPYVETQIINNVASKIP